MAYLEEVFPKFRKGYPIRRKYWMKGTYLYMYKGKVYNEKDKNLEEVWWNEKEFMADDWEVCTHSKKEPKEEYDWDYIIKNKCPCWFWDDIESQKKLNLLIRMDYSSEYKFNSNWKNCRPVRRNELSFHEDKKDE